MNKIGLTQTGVNVPRTDRKQVDNSRADWVSARHAALRLVLLAIILAAFALRIYKLDAQSFWYDEGVSATVAQSDVATLTAWTANDIQPPLYYYLAAAWGRLAGWSEWSLRFLSAFFGVLVVPLLAKLALTIGQQTRTGGLAALLTALHPLLIYYSQEARMYSLLLALGVLTGYALLKTQQGDSPDLLLDNDRPALKRPGYQKRQARSSGLTWWIVFVAAATAAVYTHYFAFFLLLALAMIYFVTRLSSPHLPISPSPHLPTFHWLLAHLIIFFLYIPWFFALFTRFAVDTSYWQGEFKWREGLRHVATSFSVGETLLESAALPYLLLYATITLLAVALLLWRKQWHVLAYSLIWITVPVVCVLLLAAINPKFNARYTMIALPGLILLWSCGIGDVREPQSNDWGLEIRRLEIKRLGDWRKLPISQSLNLLISLIATILLLLPFALSIRNWFFDPAFTKAQWRELASYVKQNVQPAERVVLVSGHAAAVWNYYAADLPAIRLPAIEILDVNAVLDYATTARTLQEQLGIATGVWLVEWQDEVVDPNKMAELVLERGGKEEPVAAQFWQLHLRHYSAIQRARLDPQLMLTAQVGDDFGSVIKLIGSHVLENDDLLLIWQRYPDAPTIPADLWMTAEVRTAAQLVHKRLSERRPASYRYPTERWKPGEIVIGRIPASDLLDAGMLPHAYELSITLFDPHGDLAGLDVFNDQGSALGKQSTLPYQPHKARPGAPEPSALNWPQTRPGVHLQPVLKQSSLAAGSRLVIEMQWYLTQPVTEESFYWLHLVNQKTNQLLFSQAFSDHILEKVTPDRLNMILKEAIMIAADVAPGDTWLEVTSDPARTSKIAQLPISILPSLNISETPAPSNDRPLLSSALHIDFMLSQQAFAAQDPPAISLLGITEPLPTQAKTSSRLDLSLVWQKGLSQNVGDLKVTLQLLDQKGKLASQIDQSIPIETVSAGLALTQTLQLKMPASAGTYRLIAALYDANLPGLPRLWASPTEDFADLGNIIIVD